MWLCVCMCLCDIIPLSSLVLLQRLPANSTRKSLGLSHTNSTRQDCSSLWLNRKDHNLSNYVSKICLNWMRSNHWGIGVFIMPGQLHLTNASPSALRSNLWAASVMLSQALWSLRDCDSRYPSWLCDGPDKSHDWPFVKGSHPCQAQWMALPATFEAHTAMDANMKHIPLEAILATCKTCDRIKAVHNSSEFHRPDRIDS